MIHYHGGPVTPLPASLALWKGRHACVSFANPEQLELAAEVCQSFILDNGAFTIWKQGGTLDVETYLAWFERWRRHPGFDWALLPDAVDAGEEEQNRLIAQWSALGGPLLDGSVVPVWHMDESLERLRYLAHAYPRVALGSAGAYAQIGTGAWWRKMGEAMDAVCDADGRPRCKLHGLRMLDPRVFSRLPLSSADSTNAAQNIGIDQKWTHAYAPSSKAVRALVIADRVEDENAAPVWDRSQADTQADFFGAAA